MASTELHKGSHSAAAGESACINIKVQGLEDGSMLIFKTQKGIQLEKLMTTYSNWISTDVDENKFFYHGRKITAEETPNSLGMEDGDEIHALRCQCGVVNIVEPAAYDIHEPETSQIYFTVVSNGKGMHFRMKKKARMLRLMEAYCDKTSIPFEHLAFVSCRRIHAFDTPEALEMKDGDEIHTVLVLPRPLPRQCS